MAAQQQQASSGGGDNALDFLWIIVMIVGGIALAWYFGRSHITSFVFAVRSYEIIAINFVLSSVQKILGMLHLTAFAPQNQNLVAWSAYIQSNPGQVEPTTLFDLSRTVGRYLSIPVAVILVLLSFVVYRHNLTAKLSTIYDMPRLKTVEQPDWPQITPVLKLDLAKQDINEGPWAMAMTPMDFCKKNQLLNIQKENEQTKVTLLQGAAYRTLSLQLGATWGGVQRLPIYAQALFGIFAARANRDREAADKLLTQINLSSADTGKLNFTGAQELAAKYEESKLVKKVTSRHAYVNTVMASMLVLARTDGVLASAEFLWLKPIDRKLWYMLNSVGRQTAVAEISGAFAHWLAEKKAGRALKVPMVSEGVKALEAAMQEIIYEAEDE